jgi:hypothetical protein
MKKSSVAAKVTPSKVSTSVDNPMMQKLLPYLLPAVVLLIVIGLGYRWYSLRTQRDGKVSPFAESVVVENLTQDDANRILKGVGDLKTAELTGNGDVTGQARYEIKDGKVRFSINADLPTPKQGSYQVWIKEIGSEARKMAFVLEMGKGGYVGSASVPEATLPFELVVTSGDTQVLSGRINK